MRITNRIRKEFEEDQDWNHSNGPVNLDLVHEPLVSMDKCNELIPDETITGLSTYSPFLQASPNPHRVDLDDF